MRAFRGVPHPHHPNPQQQQQQQPYSHAQQPLPPQQQQQQRHRADKDLAGSIPTSFLGGHSSQSKAQSGTTNENITKSALLTVPGSAMKRKSSRTELNPSTKVYLRRQSNSFTESSTNTGKNNGVIGNITAATPVPLIDRPQSSLDHDVNAAGLPSLVLAPFETSPWLEFGKVAIGTKKTISFAVENPSNQIQRLTLDSSCRMDEKGFFINQLDPLHTSTGNSNVTPLVLQPRSRTEIKVSWTPLVAGSVRASAILRSTSGRFMVNLQGRGEFPVPEYQGSNNSRKPANASMRVIKDVKTAPFNPKASVLKPHMRQSVIRSGITSTPPAPGGYTTLPYVTTNDMYDEKWIDKQERSFSQWLNHEFNVTVDSFSAKDPSSWSYYTRRLEFEHTRAAACKIYQSSIFRQVLKAVEKSIAQDRLEPRADCNFIENSADRGDILDMLFSFDIRWLVLGLETITGKEISMNPNFDQETIGGFINKAIFHDKATEDEFEPHRILSNKHKYHQAMNKLILKRIFMLMLFLDKAKAARLIPSDPCLFRKDAKMKSCRTILERISKNHLKGVGDIIKYLVYIGYSVTHVQVPLDEFDFTVKHLATDLRDGVRLCRLIDLHCPQLGLCQKMKFPTLSKAHMQQNVKLALDALVKQGISLEGTRGGVVGPRDIVEGHREKTFGLLWKLILNWKVSVLLDLSVLQYEIGALKAEYRRLHGVDQPDRVDTVYFTSDQLSALLRWCQAIGAFYNISIDNFTTSFADGRGFGALLSYYHPTLLDMSEMKDSAQFLKEYKQGLHQPETKLPETNDGKGWFIDAKEIKDPITQAKEMDRFNYRLLHNKVQALGGVPITLRHSDMSSVGVPDEKAVILFVTYLCARLMHLNKDIRAAKTIQRIWRKKHYGRKEDTRIDAAVVLQKHIRKFLIKKRAKSSKNLRNEAATLIQSGCRMYLAQIRAIQKFESVVKVQRQCRIFLARKRFVEVRWAVRTVQRYYRGHVARLHYHNVLEEHRTVASIQAQSRGHLVREQYNMLRGATEVMQTRWRALVEGRRIRSIYLNIRIASIIIQRHWRATVIARKVRQEYVEQRTWVISLQSQLRSKLARQAFLEKCWAASVIQRRLRERNYHRELRRQHEAACVIQAHWRAVVARRFVQHQYQLVRRATITIQAAVRARLVRRRYVELRQAVSIVQDRRRALVTGREYRLQFQQMRGAAWIIQDRWRALVLGRSTRAQYREVRSSLIRMQATIRGHLLRQRLLRVMRENQATMVIQASWRGHVQRRKFLQIRSAAVVLQQRWRALQQRREVQHMFQEYQWAGTVIQRWWRACKAGQETRDQYQRLRGAAIALQSVYRGQVARRQATALRAIVGIQATVRMRYTRWQFQRLRLAASLIQRYWRAHQMRVKQRMLFETMEQASIILQRQWRAVLEGRRVREEYEYTRALVIATQSHARGALVRQQYQELRWAACIIQSRWRAWVQGQEQRKVYLEQWMAARTIQDAWRSVQLVRQQRLTYLNLQHASLTIQRWWRAVLYERAKNKLAQAERHAAAVLIQTAVRGCLVRNRVRQHLEDRERIMLRWIEMTSISLAAVTIQRSWRSYQSRRIAESQLETLTLMIQTQVRGVLSRRKIMHELNSIVKIQAWWRGHQVRQDCTAKIKAARKRIEHANATAEEHMKLGNRTTMALDILLSSGQLSAVLKACYHLDVVTRLSKNSCLRLVEHNVINIIFQLIKSCNRSQPHMEVLKHALNIIENLSRDADTSGSVFWAPEGVEILVDSAQAYRENDMVFESVVRILLIHLEEDESRRRVMRAMTPEVKKLKGILAVMERKVEREKRARGHALPGKQPTSLLFTSVGRLRRIIALLQ
ncbi:hypothetical protein EC968_001423 [Mortierella alpina]|nr:hypothetical protein EC968_001423 [Mortierella alpina]